MGLCAMGIGMAKTGLGGLGMVVVPVMAIIFGAKSSTSIFERACHKQFSPCTKKARRTESKPPKTVVEPRANYPLVVIKPVFI